MLLKLSRLKKWDAYTWINPGPGLVCLFIKQGRMRISENHNTWLKLVLQAFVYWREIACLAADPKDRLVCNLIHGGSRYNGAVAGCWGGWRRFGGKVRGQNSAIAWKVGGHGVPSDPPSSVHGLFNMRRGLLSMYSVFYALWFCSTAFCLKDNFTPETSLAHF